MVTLSIKRVILIVLDSLGVGELPDAQDYGDTGSNTLSNLACAVGGLNLCALRDMGLGNILPVEGVPPADSPLASYGRMAEMSAGKDTTTGHWEIAGLILERPFPTYPNGFPGEVISSFTLATGKKVLGNEPASGTEIIERLGPRHLKTGRPIVYTSADSVFQVAAHEEIIPVCELYAICRKAREILTDEHAVGRVIARPFVGRPGSFQRTERRKDFSLPPPEETVLDRLCAAGYPVTGIGKIESIFAGRGVSHSHHTADNSEGMEKTLEAVSTGAGEGLVFTNLVDFDSLYGHRNDPAGYARALQEFDAFLPRLEAALHSTDMLIITADHGCDPTTESTDHSREYVPLLVYGSALEGGVFLGTRATFADIAATLADVFAVRGTGNGQSFAAEVAGKK